MNRGNTRPSVFHGVVVAAVFAGAGSAMFAGLLLWVGPQAALRLVATLLAGSYGLYLLANTVHKTGRIVAVVCWCVGAVGIAAFVNSLAPFLIAHAVMIWLLRSLYFHGSIVAALADLGLGALALAAAVWAALSSGSLLLAIWCLFLTHALFVLLPQPRTEPADRDDAGNQTFERARRSADAALRRLVAMNP